MTWVKIPFQDQWQNSNDVNASGFVIKTYLPGTTTPTPMAIDKNGSTTVATVTLNADGNPEVSGNEVTIYIDREFKYAIYENATDAANDINAFYGPIDNVKIYADAGDFANQTATDYADLQSKMAAGVYAAGDLVTVLSPSGPPFQIFVDDGVTHYDHDGGVTITQTGSTTVAGEFAAVRQYNGSVYASWFGMSSSASADTNDTAFVAAWAVKKNIILPDESMTLDTPILDGEQKYENGSITGGDNTVLNCTNFYITGVFQKQINNLKIVASGSIDIEGLRYCTLKSVVLNGFVRWGKYTSVLSSYSTYWNNFTQVRFAGGIEFTTSVTDANFNSNVFDTCEFRAGSQSSIMTFKQTVSANPVFSSNTFIGCDASYDPVFDIQVPHDFFSITWIGGYLDTGTPWYQTGSLKASELNVIGLRNPSGVSLDTDITADLRITTGSSRPKTHIPVSGVSYWDSKPTTITPIVTRATSASLPADGEYTISIHTVVNAGDVDAMTFNNLTSLETVSGAVGVGGYSSFTFSASAGDTVELVMDGNASADIDITFLSLTMGAGGYECYEKRDINGDVGSGTLTNAVTENVITLNIGALANAYYRFEFFHRNTDVSSGGGEKIVSDIAIATGSSSSACTINEVSRALVNGVGGTSDDSGVVTIAYTTSGTNVTITATMAGTPTNAAYKYRIFGPDRAQ